jgi:hypothetical protein
MGGRIDGFERATRLGLGFALAAIGAAGGAVLFAATANPHGIAEYAGVYWPVTVVVLILSLLAIGAIEGGLAMMRDPRVPDTESETRAGRVLGALVTAGFAAGTLVVAALAASGTVALIRAGLEPTQETYVVGGTFVLYAIARAALRLSGIPASVLARSVWIKPAVPDPGETFEHFAVRLVIGFVIGTLLLGAAIVLVGALLARG